VGKESFKVISTNSHTAGYHDEIGPTRHAADQQDDGSGSGVAYVCK